MANKRFYDDRHNDIQLGPYLNANSVSPIHLSLADASDNPIESILQPTSREPGTDQVPALEFKPDSDILESDFSQGVLQTIHAFGPSNASCKHGCLLAKFVGKIGRRHHIGYWKKAFRIVRQRNGRITCR